jgi:ferredoxin
MPTHRVSITACGEQFDCAEDSNILAAMERARCHGIPVGCRNGGCGACKVMVVSGAFHAAKMNRAVVTAEEQKKGCVLACRVFPRGDLNLQVMGRVWQNAKPTQRSPISFGLAGAAPILAPDKET